MWCRFFVLCMAGLLSTAILAANSVSGISDEGRNQADLAANPDADNDSGNDQAVLPAQQINYCFIDNQDSSVVQCKFKKNLLTIKVSVNGDGIFRFLLGTGKKGSVISKKAADKLKLEPFGETETRWSAGNAATRNVKIDSVQIGSLVWFPETFEVVDDKKESNSLFGDFDGVLGYDFLKLMPIRVDFNFNRITFYNPHVIDLEKPGIPLEINLDSHQAIGEMTFDGRAIPVLIDLASASDFVIFDDWVWANKYAERFYFDPEKFVSQGIEGYWRIYLVIRSLTLKFGEIQLERHFMIGHRLEDAQKACPAKGLIGIGILDAYNLFIDYPEHLIYFDERKSEEG